MARDFAGYRDPVLATRVYFWIHQSLGRRVVGHGHSDRHVESGESVQTAQSVRAEDREGIPNKLDALASAITRMDPDVLAVQEVGDPVALGELADRVGGTWHIETAAPEAGIDHTIRVGSYPGCHSPAWIR